MLIVIGAFGGKLGKIIAIVGFILLFLWWFGFPWVGLEPLRKYVGQVALVPLMVKQVRRVHEDPRMSVFTKAGLVVAFIGLVLLVAALLGVT